MLRILDDNIIIDGGGVLVTAESTNPLKDFRLSAYDQITLFSGEKDLFVSVEYSDNKVVAYGYVNSHAYPYVFLDKENIKEDIENVIKEFVQTTSSCSQDC